MKIGMNVLRAIEIKASVRQYRSGGVLSEEIKQEIAVAIELESGVNEMIRAIAGLIKANDALAKELCAEAGIVHVSRPERDFAMGVLRKYVGDES